MVRENVAVGASRKERPSRGPRLRQRSHAQVGKQPHLVYKLANKNGDLQLSELWQSPPHTHLENTINSVFTAGIPNKNSELKSSFKT